MASKSDARDAIRLGFFVRPDAPGDVMPGAGDGVGDSADDDADGGATGGRDGGSGGADDGTGVDAAGDGPDSADDGAVGLPGCDDEAAVPLLAGGATGGRVGGTAGGDVTVDAGLPAAAVVVDGEGFQPDAAGLGAGAAAANTRWHTHAHGDTQHQPRDTATSSGSTRHARASVGMRKLVNARKHACVCVHACAWPW